MGMPPGFLAIFTLFFAILIFAIYWQWSRRHVLLEENERLASREHAAQAKIKSLEIFTQNLLRKNADKPTEASYAEAPLTVLEARTIVEVIPVEMKILTEEDWRTYLQQFEQAYHGFIHQVQLRFANLTQAELRLFLLIKQGYDTKEIAYLLGISIAGAKKTRYRLRKKIGLEKGDNLEQFVREF